MPALHFFQPQYIFFIGKEEVEIGFIDGDADTRPTKICNQFGFKSAEFHATFVAGIIAATADNTIGVAGIGPFDILPVRVLDHCGSGPSSGVAEGILHAKNNGADVINLSLGSSVPSTTILDAVNAAHADGVVLVAASGNDGIQLFHTLLDLIMLFQ
jgi:subtilisin family serine protease